MVIKEYMPISEIKKNILSNYPYEVIEIIPVKFKDTDKQRAVYKVITSDGPKCLKKVYYDEGTLLFVYSLMHWFFLSGICVPELLPTRSGERFIRYNNSLFIVTNWIDGRKCDYDLEEDVRVAARNLGKMHRVSYGFLPIDGCTVRKGESNWYKTFNRRFLQLLQFANSASKSGDKFSKIFLDNFDYFYERAEHAVSILSSIDNRELMMPADKYNTVCHLDYVNKNLILTESNDLYVIDFDKSKIDIPVHDIGTFLKRILKRKNTSWDFDILTVTLEQYEKERPLTSTELLALFAFLEFPQKYWKVARDYYNNKKRESSKRELTSILSRVCSQKEDHDVFCNKFYSYIEGRLKSI